MCSVEQDDSGDELNGGKEVSGRFVVAGCDCAIMFDLIEEPLDEIAFSIESEVAVSFGRAINLWWDDRGDPPLGQGLDQAVGVVGLVGEQSPHVDIFDQRFGLSQIAGLAWRQGEGHGIAQSVDQSMDLGGQSAAGSADGLLTVFFRAPALC